MSVCVREGWAREDIAAAANSIMVRAVKDLQSWTMLKRFRSRIPHSTTETLKFNSETAAGTIKSVKFNSIQFY